MSDVYTYGIMPPEKKEMTMKDALELAIKTLNLSLFSNDPKMKQAAEMLRDGGPVVEKTLDMTECGMHRIYCCGKIFHGYGILRYKTREILSIDDKELEAEFEEIK